MAAGHDAPGTIVRERAVIEKFDHTADPPALMETVEVLRERQGGKVVTTTTTTPGPGQNGEPHVERHEEAAPGEAAGAAGEAGRQLPGQDGEEVTALTAAIVAAARRDPWSVMDAVGRAATETGLEVGQAMRFMSALRMQLSAPHAGPRGRQ